MQHIELFDSVCLTISIWTTRWLKILKSNSEHSASVQAECLTKSHENLQAFPPNHSDSSSIHSKRFSVWHAGLAVRPKPIGTKASTAKRATSATAHAFATFYCIEFLFHTSHAVFILHPGMIHTILLGDINYRVSSFHRYNELRFRRPTEILADGPDELALKDSYWVFREAPKPFLISKTPRFTRTFLHVK